MIRGYHVLRPHESLRRAWKRLGYVVKDSGITDYTSVIVEDQDIAKFEDDMKARRYKINCFFDSSSDLGTRIKQAVEDATREMWESVAKSFPEATTGDFGPSEHIRLEMAMEDAIAMWVRFNVTAKKQNKLVRRPHPVV